MMQEDSNGDFEIVDKKMTSLLVSDGSGSSGSGGSSMLTNVAPPAALPSFLASPLPAPAPATTAAPQFPPPPMMTSPVPTLSSGGGHPVRPPGTTTPVPSPSSIPTRPPHGSPIPPPAGSVPLPLVRPGGTPVPLPAGSVPVPLVRPGGTSVPPPASSMTTQGPPMPPPTTTFSPQSPTSCYPPPPPPVSVGPPQHPPVSGGQPEFSPVVVTGTAAAAATPPPAAVASQPSSFTSQSPHTAPSPVTSQPQPPHSAAGVDESAAIDLGGIGGASPGVDGTHAPPTGRGWFGWIRGTVSHVGHRVAERAKTSMDTMITTLDPQMKEFIHSGGDVDIVVASDKEVKVGAVREAFQMMFGKATVSGVASQVEGVAAQPVGFEAALQSAEERINFLRCSGKIHPQQPIVAVENFIVELTPDCWYDLGVLLLDDPGEDIILQTYTQVTPVPPDYVNQAKSSTPDDYPHRSTGLATTIGHIASQQLQVHHTLWQETLTGVARRELVVLAARTLAGLYRSRLAQSH